MEYELYKGQRFKHYKGGKYTVNGIYTHTETQEGLVTYTCDKGFCWARPVEMFFGYLDDGRKRFTLLEGDPEDEECEECCGEGGITAENFGHVFSFECPSCKGTGFKEEQSHVK